MAINVDHKIDVIRSFKKRKLIVNILQYLAILGAVFAIFALTHRDPTLTGLPYTTEVVLGAILFVVAGIAFYLTWKCPSCKKFLGISVRTKACRKCSTIFEGGEGSK
jgi:protein-S-isoprenylcysteine O-methyltransferase Ste14